MKKILTLILLFISLVGSTQQTRVSGTVWDANTGEKMPFVKVQFVNSKIGILTDSVGNYVIETYYATDSIQFSFNGYITSTFSIDLDKSQEINVRMTDPGDSYPPSG